MTSFLLPFIQTHPHLWFYCLALLKTYCKLQKHEGKCVGAKRCCINISFCGKIKSKTSHQTSWMFAFHISKPHFALKCKHIFPKRICVLHQKISFRKSWWSKLEVNTLWQKRKLSRKTFASQQQFPFSLSFRSRWEFSSAF